MPPRPMGGGLLSAAGTKPPLVDVLKPQQPYPKEVHEKFRRKIFLLNASREFTKGDPKNFIPDSAIGRIATQPVHPR